MSDDRAEQRSAAPRGRTLAIVALLGAFLLASCQAAEDGSAVESRADEPTQSAAESVAAASLAPEESEGGSASGEVRLTVSQTAAGPALAGEDGMTLYVLFGDDYDGSGCTDECVAAWPPFTIEAGTEVVVGEGVTGEFPTATRFDGTTQVTWYERPLYYHAGDGSPGDANGDEVGGVWHVVEQ